MHQSTTGGGAPRTARALEESLQRLDGVRWARVEPPDAARPHAVHVATTPGWRPEVVRRDVGALLLQRHGLELDPRSVHVTDDDPVTLPPPPVPVRATGARPALDALHLTLRSDGTSVVVELVQGHHRRTGEAGPVSPGALLRAVATATTQALRDGLRHTVEPEVVDVVRLGHDRVAMATVLATHGRERQRLNGSALVRGNEEDAMARAVLDATNRLWDDVPTDGTGTGRRHGVR